MKRAMVVVLATGMVLCLSGGWLLAADREEPRDKPAGGDNQELVKMVRQMQENLEKLQREVRELRDQNERLQRQLAERGGEGAAKREGEVKRVDQPRGEGEARREGEVRREPVRREGDVKKEGETKREGEPRREGGARRDGVLRGTFVKLVEVKVGEQEVVGVVVRTDEGKEPTTVYVPNRKGENGRWVRNPELMTPLQKLSEGQRIEIGWILDGAQQWVRRVGPAEKAEKPAGVTEREPKRESDRR